MADKNEFKKSQVGTSGPTFNDDGSVDGAMTLNDLLTLLANLAVTKDGGIASVTLTGYRAGSGNAFFGIRSARGSLASPAIVQSNDQVAGFSAYAHDGTTFKEVGKIAFLMDGTPAAGDMPTRINFYLVPDGADIFETAMRLRNSKLLEVLGDLTVDGDTTLGDASTDLVNVTGRFLPRTVNDAGMDATAGTKKEIVWNEADSKHYACTVTGSPATWQALW